jgi:hypothetical protein
VADHLKRELGAESTLVEGDRGEFTVWLGRDLVASKEGDEFPSPEQVAESVRSVLKKRVAT